jgi:hypothetical protein
MKAKEIKYAIDKLIDKYGEDVDVIIDDDTTLFSIDAVYYRFDLETIVIETFEMLTED